MTIEPPIFDELRWLAVYRRGELVPHSAVVEHPVLMQRMKDFGTPERVAESDHWRRKETD
jgi:hypothetical protein